MKKLITLVLALAMVLSLAACGGSKDGSTEGTKKSDYPKYAITVVTSKSGSAVDNNCRALTQYLGEKLGVNIVVSNASGQNEALREVMNADKDGYTRCAPSGIVPDFAADDDPRDQVALGDPSEPMLAAVLALIDGDQSLAVRRPSARRSSFRLLPKPEPSLPGRFAFGSLPL